MGFLDGMRAYDLCDGVSGGLMPGTFSGITPEIVANYMSLRTDYEERLARGEVEVPEYIANILRRHFPEPEQPNS